MRFAVTQIDRFISKLNRVTILVSVVLVILLLGLLDFSTGLEVSFDFLYLFPIAIATWYLGMPAGRIIVVLSVLIWAVGDHIINNIYSNEITRLWDIGVGLTSFLFYAEIVHGLKMAILHEQLLSRTDFLTGISNIREFNDRVNLEILRAQRNGRPITIAYMDLDSFKQVNDTLGHSKGDEALTTIATTASSVIRGTDVFARLGGDEFGFLFPNTGQAGARWAVEKIKKALDNKMYSWSLPVGFSFGVVTFLSPPKSIDEILSKADQLMYEMKQNGKNGIGYETVEN